MTVPIRVSEIYYIHNGTRNRAFALYKCPICENIWETSVTNINTRSVKSCGCTKLGNRTHGMHKTTIYRVWANMRQRCYSRYCPEYENYGGRGIKVCKEWEDFENFYEDMDDPPEDDMSLDRIDNDGDYCKENCRWATQKEQARNKQNTLYLTDNDGVTKSLSEWAEILGEPYNLLFYRHKAGWTADEIFYGKD